MPTDRDEHDKRAARINVILEELRLNTEDLHELAKHATDRSWEVRAQCAPQPVKKTR